MIFVRVLERSNFRRSLRARVGDLHKALPELPARLPALNPYSHMGLIRFASAKHFAFLLRARVGDLLL